MGSHNKPQVETDPNTNALAPPKLVRELTKRNMLVMINSPNIRYEPIPGLAPGIAGTSRILHYESEHKKGPLNSYPRDLGRLERK